MSETPTSPFTPPHMHPAAAAAAVPRKIEDEFSAMEAVRELLFGRRLAELQQVFSETKEQWKLEVQRIDKTHLAGVSGLRLDQQNGFTAANAALTEAKASQAEKHREFELALQKLAERQVSLEKAFSSSLSQVEARINHELGVIKSELAEMHQTMPKTDHLAHMFRLMAERMRDGLGDRAEVNGTERTVNGHHTEPTDAELRSAVALPG